MRLSSSDKTSYLHNYCLAQFFHNAAARESVPTSATASRSGDSRYHVTRSPPERGGTERNLPPIISFRFATGEKTLVEIRTRNFEEETWPTSRVRLRSLRPGQSASGGLGPEENAAGFEAQRSCVEAACHVCAACAWRIKHVCAVSSATSLLLYFAL